MRVRLSASLSRSGALVRTDSGKYMSGKVEDELYILPPRLLQALKRSEIL